MLQSLVQLYRSRALIAVLVQRELKARYRGTALGLLWSFVNPLLMTIIYSLVFSIYMRISIPHYPVFLLCGLLAWNCFVAGLNEGTMGIIASAGIIKKIYLPAEVFPLVYVLSNTVHYLLSLPILIAAQLYFGVPITWAWLALPIVLLVQIAFTYGCVLFTSALAVQYRDLIHILPNVVMVVFMLSPIFYPNSQVPERFRIFLALNPFAYLMEAYHRICMEGLWPDALGLSRFALSAVLVLLVGWWVFNRGREHFAESI